MDKIVVDDLVETNYIIDSGRYWKFNAHFEEDKSLKLTLIVHNSSAADWFKYHLGKVVTPDKITYFDEGETKSFYRKNCKWNDSVEAEMWATDAIKQGLLSIDEEKKKKEEREMKIDKVKFWSIFIIVISLLPAKCTMLKITEVNQPKNIEKAMEAYNNGDYETSLKYWNKTDLKKDKPKDLSFFRDETDRVGKIRKSSVWWVRKANTYEKLGQKEKAEYLFNKIYSDFVWTENNYPGHIKSNYPDVYQGIINSDTYKQKHEEAVKAHKEFLDELSKCQTVTSRWLEYNGELGTIYRILAIPYWSDDYTFWIDDGKSDKLAGGIFLYTDINKDYLKKEFKDLAYYAAPTYFYIKYYNRKSELVYIED